MRQKYVTLRHHWRILDEAHFRQDTDEGYGGSVKGERFWVSSSAPGLGAKVSRYGVYFTTPYAVADRLWVKTHLDPEEEKLRVSK